MSSEKMKHLEFIQAVITRMNQNSFQIKTWMITIVSALLALSAGSDNKLYVGIAIFSVIIFWFLDSYYLQMERKSRGIYNDVAEISPDDQRKEIKDFDVPIKLYNGGKYGYWSAFLSKTIFLLYGMIIVALVIVIVISWVNPT